MQKYTLSEVELRKIRETVEGEFPHDPALQEVHIAREILTRSAKRSGMSLLQYSSRLAKVVRAERGM